MLPDSLSSFSRASGISPASVSWLWPGWLPRGKLTLFEGDPGLGKSLLTLDLCARLTTGRPMPDGAPAVEPCNVIVINGEDAAGDTIVPRLTALSADLNRVFVYQPQEAAVPFSLPDRLESLDKLLALTGAGLVVIDPLTAFLDRRVCVNSDHSVRQLFAPLACLANKHQATILMVRHLVKKDGHNAVYRGVGSIGIIAACRAAWLITRDPSPSPARAVLAQLKNNVSSFQPSLSLEISVQKDVPPTISFLGSCPWTAAQLQALSMSARARNRDIACDLLEDFLYDAPRTSRDVWDWAREHSIPERMMDRAKSVLGIRSLLLYKGKQRSWYWLLPHHSPPDSDHDPDSLEPWLKPLREMFPPSTPLDKE